ncbi:uncharacterized protein LOC127093519 isoform X3 [Lathyrus oleraceus]|uniref:uncharacterized protein LOC127093519 isoform X3 n=1 Tax=Pisum sativum TaxID=3888 RepID=UPI0021CE3E6B|nr:uncharacterized protein LOC127093519 isoform X3 [Pisum sativum]
MSFDNQIFWMGKSNGDLNGSDDMTYDNSRGESKRSNQWFVDGPEMDLSPNKKQAVEAPNSLLPGLLNSNISSWGDSLSFHSLTGHFTAQLFDPGAASMNFEDANIDTKLSAERKDILDPFGGDASFGLSMLTTLEDSQPAFNHDGTRNVKVNEVKESRNFMFVPTNNPCDGVSSTVSHSHASKEGDNSISTSLTYNNGDANVILVDGAFDRMDTNLMSTSQTYNKGDGNLSVPPTYKEICNTILMDQGYINVDSDAISIAHAYNKACDNSMLSNHLFNKVEDDTILMGQTYHQRPNDMSFVSHSYNKGESTIISFGGCDDDDAIQSDSFVSDYALFMGQAPSHMSQVANEKELVRSSSKLIPSTTQMSAFEAENVPRTKEEMKMSKKATSNNFPSNVRSLLSTGMLDGVSVKYKAWSREELRAVIKGAGYLCSCPSCNFSKVINAYEFERHAGCKTKHPNNHIYFENGKTIYGVVQELRSTPQNMLFEVIQTITGSPIHQKSFRIWKESFLAAARELQRICGKD